jgi:hypothetical protein
MRFLQRIPFLPNFFACPVECLPNEVNAYFIGAKPIPLGSDSDFNPLQAD